MNSRQIIIATMNFDNPERLPVVYHPSNAGLYVHGDALLQVFRQYPPDNPIAFNHVPQPPPATISEDGRYYEEKTDAWGTRWGYHTFGIQGQPVAYPFENWVETRDYQFPVLPDINSDEFKHKHLISEERRENYLIIEGWISIFQQLYALYPMEDFLMDLAMEDMDLLAFLERLVGYCDTCIEFLLAKSVDVIMFADDWASQAGPMVSPDTFRKIFKPHYRKMFKKVHDAGKKVFFHCCGQMGYIFDELIELGIDGLWHQSVLYDTEEFAEKCRQTGITVYLHPDRQQLIPFGTPEQIRAHIKKWAERYHRLGGGAIFYVEIENDAPFENAKALIEAIHEYR